jgi:protein O-mannosyl-transferase
MPSQKKQTTTAIEKSNTAARLPALALLITAVLYIPSLHNGFTNFDDIVYILDNPYLKELSLRSVGTIFTTFYAGNYHPLTTISWLLEYHLFGPEPFIYHATNLVLHLVNTLLTYLLCKRLSGQATVGFIVALLFGIHPLHVESVAWISERKDTLYTVFYLAAALAYLHYTAGRKVKWYLVSFLLFVLALLSKSAAVTLPLLLLIFDVYQRRKLNAITLAQKLPFFLLSLVFGIVAIHSQEAGDTLKTTLDRSPVNHIFEVFYGVAFYLVKLVLPFGLSAMHPFPHVDGKLLPFQYYASLPFILILVWLALRPSLFRRHILFGATFFLAAVSVMLQIIPVGMAVVAERYTYVSYIGLFYIAGVFLYQFKDKLPRPVPVAAFGSFCVLCFVLSWLHIGVWEDSYTLFGDIIKKNPDHYFAYWARGNQKYQDGDLSAALEDYEAAIRRNPGMADLYYNRGNAFLDLSNVQEAIISYDAAIRLDSTMKEAYNTRGWARFTKGDTTGAIADLNIALSLDTAFADAFGNRGAVEAALGNWTAALHDYDQSLRLAPDNIKILLNRGLLKANAADFSGAVADFTAIIRLNGQHADAYLYRGLAYSRLNALSSACSDWQMAAQLGNANAGAAMAQYCR